MGAGVLLGAKRSDGERNPRRRQEEGRMGKVGTGELEEGVAGIDGRSRDRRGYFQKGRQQREGLEKSLGREGAPRSAHPTEPRAMRLGVTGRPAGRREWVTCDKDTGM